MRTIMAAQGHTPQRSAPAALESSERAWRGWGCISRALREVASRRQFNNRVVGGRCRNSWLQFPRKRHSAQRAACMSRARDRERGSSPRAAASDDGSVLVHTETLFRGAVAFLPTILVAIAFVVITFVDVGALAQQIQGLNATHIRSARLSPPPPPPVFVPPTFLSFTRLRCTRGGTPKLMRLLAPLANELRRTEPHTLTFQLLRSEQEPDLLLLWERFRSRADMLRLHQATAAYGNFRQQLVRSGVVEEATQSSWASTNVGFSGRQHARLSNRSSPRTRKHRGRRV